MELNSEMLTQAHDGARVRIVRATALVALVMGVAIAIFSASPDGGFALFRPRAAPLSEVLTPIVRDHGADAGIVEYRKRRAQGFRGVSERESDLNDLGYHYLQQGDTASAIRLFGLNVEAHPGSANVHDSLGEAYTKAGRGEQAVAQYQEALALEPNLKSSAVALAKFTGRPRKPYPPVLMVHIIAGALAVGLGFSALFLRKGSSPHRVAGIAFSIAMLCMCVAGLVVAVVRSEVPNVFAASLTAYLVATAWLSAVRRNADSTIDWALLTLVLAVACGETVFGLEAAGSAPGTRDGFGPLLYFTFGAVAFVCAFGDIRKLVRGMPPGIARIRRHLWRMCLALFIASSSVLIGQEQLFPQSLRDSHLLNIITFVPLAMMIFWMLRIRLRGARGRMENAMRTAGPHLSA